MTLNKHRSNLIPDVVLSGDGTIFVTDREGTFPLRHGKSQQKNVLDVDFTEPDHHSFRSYDPKRDNNNRRYKQRANRYKEEVATLSGTISTLSSHSLGRRLRRSKSVSEKVPKQKMENFSVKANGSIGGSTGRGGRKFRGETPKITAEFAATLRLKKKQQEEKKRQKFDSIHDISPGSGRKWSLTEKKTDHNELLLSNNPMFRNRKLHEERLPYVLFLVVGVLLVLLGIARILFIIWHEYFCILWTGALVLVLGVIGATHRSRYLDVFKTRFYILLGYLTAAAALLSSLVLLRVLIPTILLLTRDVEAAQIPDQVTFTLWRNKSLVGIPDSGDTATWVAVGFDCCGLLMLLVSFFSMSAAMMAFVNHYDAAFDTTGECDHRGNPAAFNPMEQSSLGQSTIFGGIVMVTLIDSMVKEPKIYHYYSPVWCGAAVIFAGFISICFGKRPDRRALGIFSLIVQVFAMCACSVATVVVNLNMVDDIQRLLDQNTDTGAENETVMDETLISVIAYACYDVFMVVNIVFSVGVMFAAYRKMCFKDDDNISLVE